MFKKILAIAAIAGALTLAPIHDADAAVDAFLTLKGAKGVVGGGDVRGKKSTTQTGLKVLSFTHKVTVPHDSHAAAARGNRQHSPFTVTIEFDTNIIAILIGLMTSGEQLQGTITFKTGKKGTKQQDYMTFELEHVMVSSYSIKSTTGGDDVIELELKAKSFKGKLADGSVFVSSVASTPTTVKSAK